MNRQPTTHAADDSLVGPIVDIDTCFDTVDHFSVDVSTSGRDGDVRGQTGRVDVGAEIVDAGRVVVNIGLVFQAVFAEEGHVSKVAALGIHTVASTNLEIETYIWYHYVYDFHNISSSLSSVYFSSILFVLHHGKCHTNSKVRVIST